MGQSVEMGTIHAGDFMVSFFSVFFDFAVFHAKSDLPPVFIIVRLCTLCAGNLKEFRKNGG